MKLFIQEHSLVYQENKKKIKANSFFIFKLKDNKFEFENKKINLTKKNKSVDMNQKEKLLIESMNEELKTLIENYIEEHEIDVKNNISKILYNEPQKLNKLNFCIDEDKESLIVKNEKYNCVFSVPYLILIFTTGRSCEVFPKLKIKSFIGSNIVNNKNNQEDEDENKNDLESLESLSNISELTSNNNSKSSQEIKEEVNKTKNIKILKVVTDEPKKRGRPKKN